MMHWEFPDGQILLVTHHREGHRATVLQLPAERKNDSVSSGSAGSAIGRRVERCNGEARDAGSGRGRRSAAGARCLQVRRVSEWLSHVAVRWQTAGDERSTMPALNPQS